MSWMSRSSAVAVVAAVVAYSALAGESSRGQQSCQMNAPLCADGDVIVTVNCHKTCKPMRRMYQSQLSP